MRTIYKYPFPKTGEFTIRLPLDSEILHVGMQGETPCLWALVETLQPSSDVRFRLFGTGHEVIGDPEHVATFHDGPFVWHLFRV